MGAIAFPTSIVNQANTVILRGSKVLTDHSSFSNIQPLALDRCQTFASIIRPARSHARLFPKRGLVRRYS